MGSKEASAVRQAGALIFHVAPSMVSVNNLSEDTWIIEKDGVHVVGKISPKGSKFSFEITEGDRELVGTSYIV